MLALKAHLPEVGYSYSLDSNSEWGEWRRKARSLTVVFASMVALYAGGAVVLVRWAL